MRLYTIIIRQLGNILVLMRLVLLTT